MKDFIVLIHLACLVFASVTYYNDLEGYLFALKQCLGNSSALYNFEGTNGVSLVIRPVEERDFDRHGVDAVLYNCWLDTYTELMVAIADNTNHEDNDSDVSTYYGPVGGNGYAFDIITGSTHSELTNALSRLNPKVSIEGHEQSTAEEIPYFIHDAFLQHYTPVWKESLHQHI